MKFNQCICYYSSLIFVILLPVCIADTLSPEDMTDFSLEDLMDVEVVSVSKKSQKLSQVSAAAYVITSDEIKRSGVTSIAEALRLAPGVNVAQIDSNKWAISIRGFNTLYSNKLLVMVDGRSVYSPFFSGVHWDIQDLILNDIEQIEVIRGPGATMWGANAVNGVINIITKSAEKTSGTYVSVLGGNNERGNIALRYGDSLSNDADYRVYAKYFKRNSFEIASGDDGKDDWSVARAGFRVDWNQSIRDAVTVIANAYQGENGAINSVPVLTQPYRQISEDQLDIKGGDILVRWSRFFSDVSDFNLQVYYEKISRVDDVFDENLDTYDLDFQHRFPATMGHEIVWGMGYRTMRDDTKGSFAYSFFPQRRTTELYSIFVQDDISLLEDRLILTVGAKVERQDYTGTEFQPNIRALWKSDESTSIWAAVSKAVRTPSRNDSDARINFMTYPIESQPGIGMTAILGEPNMASEELLSYELGYRTQATESLNIDLTAFLNQYTKLRDTAPSRSFFEMDPAPPHMVFAQSYNNSASADSYGFEAVINYRPIVQWRLTMAISLFELDMESDNGFTKGEEGNTPSSQYQLRSSYELPYNAEYNVALYYVNKLKNQKIPDYTRLDMTYLWRPWKKLELFIAGQNLLDKSHQEFGSVPFTIATEVPRSFYLGVTYRVE